MITEDPRHIGRWVNADMGGPAGSAAGAGVGSWLVSLMMAATAWGVLSVMVAQMVTWCMSLRYGNCKPEVLGNALLDAADQHGGGVDALDVGGLVGREQRDAFAGQFPFQLQRVERVPAAALDVLADHSGEPGSGGGRFGQHLGHPPITGEAGGGELLVRPALAAVLNVDRAGLDIPVIGGDVPAGRQPFLSGPELPL
jgi:hypothetical protein